MEWSESIMFFLGILAIILGNAAFVVPLFLWSRSESRADFRQLLEITDLIKQDIKQFQNIMYIETKDFHGRLISLETKKDLEDKK